jgi:hypothetical protein
MPAHRTSMRKSKEVLRLKWACGLTHRQISRAVGISVGAVSKLAALASQAGLDWDRVEPLSDDELEARLHPTLPEAASSSKRIEPDYAVLHRELRRKGVTLQLLWVVSILEAGLDQQPAPAATAAEWQAPEHENVRGPDYYHVWTPPVCQAVFHDEQKGRDCGHVSGLSSPGPWPDPSLMEYAGRFPNTESRC